MRRIVVLLPLALLPACATIVNGSSQTVTVSTTPPAATCTLDRVGERIGAIAATPGSVRIDKSKNDLSVTCSKSGYQTATVTHSSKFSGVTFGNFIAGGAVGFIVDASTGANFSYPEDIRLELAQAAMPRGPGISLNTPTSDGTPRAMPVSARQ